VSLDGPGVKIVYLAEYDLPNQAAHGVHVMHMCEALSDLGHEVVLVLAREQDKPSPAEELYRYYGLRQRFRIERVRRSMTRGGIYVFALKVARLVGKERPDLVYGRFLAGCVVSACVGARGAPVVYETHAAVRQSGWVSDRLFKFAGAMKLLNYIVVVTQGLKNNLMQTYRVPAERMIVARCGVGVRRRSGCDGGDARDAHRLHRTPLRGTGDRTDRDSGAALSMGVVPCGRGRAESRS
jgi:hypothetical protein